MKRMERTEKVIGENTFYIVPFAAIYRNEYQRRAVC